MKEAARSGTFQIVFVTSPIRLTTSDVSEERIEALSFGRGRLANAAVIRLQLEDCRKKNELTCLLWKPYNGMTGYLLGRGDQLVTAMHGFRKSIDSQARRNGYNGDCPEPDETHAKPEDYPLCYSIRDEKARKAFLAELRDEGVGKQILVINSDREIVYRPIHEKQKTKISLLPNDSKTPYDIRTGLAYGYENIEKVAPTYDPTRDWIVISLPESIGTPVALAKNISIGEETFLAGYPIETNRPNSFNSNGESLLFSFGRALSMDEALVLDPGLSGMGYTQGKNGIEFIVTNTDAVTRSSGGPYFNREGQAVGMVKMVIGDVFDGVADSYTYMQENPSPGSLGGSSHQLTVIERLIREL